MTPPLAKGARWAHAIAPDAVNRERDDFYPTSPPAMRALLPHLRPILPRDVWEPACGTGDIARILIEAGYRVHATDLIDRGYGQGGVDFLRDDGPPVGAIVTNPPFKLWRAFVWRAKSRARVAVVVLGRLGAITGAKNAALHYDAAFPLVLHGVFAGRLPMWRGRLWQAGDGSSMIDFAWYVYRRGGQPGWRGVILDPEGVMS